MNTAATSKKRTTVAKHCGLAAGISSIFLVAGCVSVPELPMGRPATSLRANNYVARAQNTDALPDLPTPPLALPPILSADRLSALTETAPANALTDPAITQLDPTDPTDEFKPDIKLRGRINTDAIFVGQSPQNQATLGSIPDATGFRRARLGAEGTVGPQVDWVAEFDFAGGAISFRDVYIGIDKLPLIRRIQYGHMLEPFSLEVLTSPNFFAFVECSPIAALDPNRNWGVLIMSYTENERATFQVGAFRSGTSNSSGDDFSGQNDMAYDVRATILPWYQDNGRRLFTVGAAFSNRFPADNVVTINTGPQSNLLSVSEDPGTPFIPKITVPANQQQLLNAEAALVLGSLSFQAEWSGTIIEQIGGGPVFLHGFYVYGSWFLTGENRSYLTKDGVFGNIHVRSPFLLLREGPSIIRGPGAWELTARFAYADFVSPNLPLSKGLMQGAQEPELTVGVNWYLNDSTRLMFNYVFTVPVDPNAGPSTAQAFFLRAAIFW
jgi:phosphate-selective porin OprO/OprP